MAEEVHGTLKGTLSSTVYFKGSLADTVSMSGKLSIPSRSEANRDYEFLYNKPQIETVELVGNKTFEDLGLERISNSDILDIVGG